MISCELGSVHMVHQKNWHQMEAPFQSYEYAQLLSYWGIRQCLPSAHYAQSNGRAELAMQSAKYILLTNTDSAGCLNYDNTGQAFLNHQNSSRCGDLTCHNAVWSPHQRPSSSAMGHSFHSSTEEGDQRAARESHGTTACPQC